MRVKIGNKIYDSNFTPIMLIFEKESERKAIGKQIFNMEEKEENTIRKYCRFPVDIYEKLKNGDKNTEEYIKQFMNKI
jgi:hypothetical protein